MSSAKYAPDDCTPEEWEQYRKKTLERDGYTCRKCGKDDRELHADHKKPMSHGGKTQMGNLQTLCFRCHNVKTKRETGKWIEKPSPGQRDRYPDELFDDSTGSNENTAIVIALLKALGALLIIPYLLICLVLFPSQTLPILVLIISAVVIHKSDYRPLTARPEGNLVSTLSNSDVFAVGAVASLTFLPALLLGAFGIGTLTAAVFAGPLFILNVLGLLYVS